MHLSTTHSRCDTRCDLDQSSGVPASRAALVTAVALVAGLAVWGLARWLGVDPVVGKSNVASVGPVNVMVAALVAGFAAWGVQTLLRRAGHGAWWPFVASTALSVSMIGPGYQADGASVVALTVMHLVVGAVLIGGLELAAARHVTAARGGPAR